MKIQIEDASKKDIPFILKGIKEVCKIEKQKPEKDRFLVKEIKKAIKNKKLRIAKIKDKTFGFIQFTFSSKEPYGPIDYGKHGCKYCWIEWMYVSENLRRKKVGAELYKDVEKICKNKKIKEIMLDVFAVNKNARKFYKKEGLKQFIIIEKEGL